MSLPRVFDYCSHRAPNRFEDLSDMPAKKIVLMNHTDMQGHHFGCARVMRIIEQELEARGGEIIGRLDGKQNWQTTPEALAVLTRADKIVINGEGTLHGGRKKAGWLIDIAEHPVAVGKSLSLINTIYQNTWELRLFINRTLTEMWGFFVSLYYEETPNTFNYTCDY